MFRESGLGFSKVERSWETKKRSIKNYAYHGIMFVWFAANRAKYIVYKEIEIWKEIRCIEWKRWNYGTQL